MSAITKPAGATTSWPVVMTVTVAGIVAAFQIGKLPASVPTLRADLSLSLIEAGWVIAALAVVGMATGMIWGFVADRFGHRRLLLSGMGVIALGTVGGSFAGTGAELMASRVVEGCGYITVLAAGPALIGAFTAERDRSMALGIWAWYMPFGLGVMILLTPVFIAAGSWRDLWLFNGALALIALAATAYVTRGPRGGQIAGAGGGNVLSAIWRTVTSPGPITLAICFGAYSLVYLTVSSFLPTFLIEERGYAPDIAAYWVALTVFVNAPGCVLGGWLLRRGLSAAAVVAIAYLGMLVSIFGIFADQIDPALRLGFATFMPFIGGLIPPAVLSRARNLAASPLLVSTCIGLISQVLMLTQLIGPPILAALVTGRDNWERANYLTVPLILLGLVAAAALARLDRAR